MKRRLFNQFSAKLEAEGVYAKSGSIIDATIVEVPKQRNSREENARIKAGYVPAEWDDNKSSDKDTDARIGILVGAFIVVPLGRNIPGFDSGILLSTIALLGNFNDRGVYNRAAFGINALGFQFC